MTEVGKEACLLFESKLQIVRRAPSLQLLQDAPLVR